MTRRTREEVDAAITLEAPSGGSRIQTLSLEVLALREELAEAVARCRVLRREAKAPSYSTEAVDALVKWKAAIVGFVRIYDSAQAAWVSQAFDEVIASREAPR